MMQQKNDIWTRTQVLPDDPRFYRRTLDELPTPLVVVDDEGRVVYGNQAMLDLGGWTEAGGLNADLLGFIHPDDVEQIAGSFLTMAEAEAPSDQWAPIMVRLVDYSGNAIHVEVTGRNRIEDEIIGGVIFSVRPVKDQFLERRVIRAIANGSSRSELLEMVMEIISAPPQELAGGVVSMSDERSMSLVATTHPEFDDLASGATLSELDGTLLRAATEARSFSVVNVDGVLGERFAQAGFVMGWHQVVRADPVSLIVLSRRHHASDIGVRQRLQIACDLIGAILQATD